MCAQRTGLERETECGVRGSWWLKAQSRSSGRSRPPSPRSVWSATRGRRLPPLSSLVSKRPDPDADTHPPAQTGPVLCTLRSSEDEDEPVTGKGAETERAPEGGCGVGPGALRAQALCAFFVRLFIHSFICSFIHSFVRSFVRSCVYSFLHLSFYWLIHSFIHSNVWFPISFVSSSPRFWLLIKAPVSGSRASWPCKGSTPPHGLWVLGPLALPGLADATSDADSLPSSRLRSPSERLGTGFLHRFLGC